MVECTADTPGEKVPDHSESNFETSLKAKGTLLEKVEKTRVLHCS